MKITAAISIATILLSIPTVTASSAFAQEEAETIEERTLALYDVFDLTSRVVTPMNEQLAGSGLVVSSGVYGRTSDSETPVPLEAPVKSFDPDAWLDDVDAEQRERLLREETQYLAATVSTWITPSLESGGAVRGVSNGTLVVLGDREQHAWVEAFLKRQREFRRVLDAELRLFEAPAGTFAKLGFEESSAALEGEDATKSLLAALEGAGVGIPSRHSYQLFGTAGQSTGVTGMGRYVKEWKVVTVHPGKKIADPVIENLTSGSSTGLRPVDLGNGLYGMSLTYSKTEIVRPIPTVKTSLEGVEGEYEISIPEVRKYSLDTRLQIREGSSALAWFPLDGGRGELAVLVSLRAESGGK